MEEAELTSWRFVSSPFSLDLSKTKQQLIPGVPFLLQALVRDMSGSPASGIPVKVSAKLFSGSTSKNQDFEQNTDGSGQVIVSIGVPRTISEVQLSVSAGSPYPAVGSLTVKAIYASHLKKVTQLCWDKFRKMLIQKQIEGTTS